MALHCRILQGHWREEDVLPQILSQWGYKTGQRKAVLDLRHYCQQLWHTLLPPQMLVGSSWKTSLKELRYLTPIRARGGHQKNAGSKVSLLALNHRDQQEPELQTHLYLLSFSGCLLWVSQHSMYLLTWIQSLAPNSSSSLKLILFSQWDQPLGILCSKLETILRTCKPVSLLSILYPMPVSGTLPLSL